MSDSKADHQENKICSKCDEEKSFDEFNADSRRKDGKRASCKICDAEQKKRIRYNDLESYRLRNAENNRNYRARMKGKNIAE